MRFHLRSALILGAILAAMPAMAEEPPPPKIAAIATGLDSPMSVAIQPGSGVVFVAESGAGRIVRLTSDSTVEVVGGLPTTKVEFGKQIASRGPWGLAFADRNLLAVGCTAQTGGKTPVRVYDISSPAGKIAADKMKHGAMLAPAADKKNSSAGNIVGMVNDGAGHLVIASSDAEHADRGWLGQIQATEELIGNIVPLVGTGGDQPGALTISPRGEWVTAESSAAKLSHSLLKFYNPQSKKELLRLDTGLRDVSGLAYSPRTGWLYATAPAQGKTEGGLFRLDRAMVDGKPGVKAVLVTKLERPTGMVFAPNGALYVTLLGKADSEGKEKSGSVVRLTGRM